MTAARPYPLEGVTVLDLGQIYNGPYATFMLAMAGAHVIKVEAPTGDNLRRRSVVGGAALPFAMLNSNKDCVTLNLKSEAGRALLLRLVKRVDVLVENFKPGTMARLGVGPDRLLEENPRLIYAAGSGYGQDGPYRDYPAMDLTVQAMSGVMDTTGFPDRPPVKAGPAMCDFMGGVHLYGAIATALFERERTGEGRVVEVAMLDSVYFSLSSSLGMWWGSGGTAMPRTGNRHGGLAESPYNVYPAKDGYLALICVGEGHWRNLCAAMEREDLMADPRFADLKSRVEHMHIVDEIVGGFTARFDRGPLFQLLIDHGVPCAPVRNLDEVVNDPHMHARGMLSWIDHPDYGRVPLPGSPMRYGGAPPLPLEPSQKLGAANDDIYGDWLGLDPEQIAELKRDGAI